MRTGDAVEYFLGRYVLVDPIAAGGSSSVWRAWDARRREYVAAKLLRAADAASLLRFVREQSLRVEHPHVLAPTGWAAEDDRVLLTMDLVRGGSVAGLIGDHGPLPVPYAAVLIDQLFGALSAIHARGIVHRDVKPSNLLLELTGQAPPLLRLADFGIAAVLGEPRLTHTRQVVGSPGYVAPEVQTGADPDPRQDLYGVGVVALQLLVGIEVSAATSAEEMPCPEGVPGPLWTVIRSLLARSPAQRPASAHAARQAWRSAVRAVGAPTGPADATADPVEVFDHVGPLPDGFGAAGPVDGPAAPPRDVLVDRLETLWSSAGRPSEEVLRSLAGTDAGTGGFATDALPAGALRRILAGPTPRWEEVRPFVVACLRAGGSSPDQIAAELDRWREAVDGAALRPSEPAPTIMDTSSPSDRGPVRSSQGEPRPVVGLTRRSGRQVLVAGLATVVVLAGIGIGVARLARGVFIGAGSTTVTQTQTTSVPAGSPSTVPTTTAVTPPTTPPKPSPVGTTDDGSTAPGALGGRAPTEAAAPPTVAPVAQPGPILANGTFDSGTTPWWSSPNVAIAAENGRLLAAVSAGTTNRWDAMVAHDFSPLRGGRSYTLSFDASASIPRNIVVTVQMGQSPYSNTLWKNPEIETFTKHYSYTFTSNIDNDWGLVTFQLGDNGPFTFRLDNVSLVLND